jgi:hypothetical protein
MPQVNTNLTPKEKKESNERFTELAPTFSKGASPVELDASLPGLEPLAQKLDETGKKILNIILTDFSAENEVEAEKDIFKKLRNACARAGMLDKKYDQITFFKTLADPQFMNIVKTTGQGIVGMYIVPVVSKMIAMALEGDKTAIKWVLEITGLMQSKYDFYLNRYSLTHNTINAENINFEGKTDAELATIISDFDDECEAEIASGSN